MQKKMTILLIITLILTSIMPFYAYANQVGTVIVVGKNEGQVDPLFKSDGLGAQGPWYPGYSATGILRIQNNYGSRIKIASLGMNISLSKGNRILSFEDTDGRDYMEKMKIKIQYKNPITNLLLGEIYNGNFLTFTKGVPCSISIGNNNSYDLIYTIKMDEEAKVNVAGIVGVADFTVRLEGDETGTGPGGESGGQQPTNPTQPVTELELEETRIPYAGHWAQECITTLLEMGIIQGYPDGSIMPDNYITRAEAAVLVARALNLEEKHKYWTGYLDMIPSWAKGYINSVTDEEIFEGYPFLLGRVFKPGQNITREEMTKVLVKAFNVEADERVSIDFNDKNDISQWAMPFIEDAVANEVIQGYPDGSFKPSSPITRAEVFSIICRLLKLREESSSN